MSETSDAGSMIHAYLASKGLQPTAENVSRALQMNAQNPGMISGLVNQAPPEADAQPSMVDQVMQRSAAPAPAPMPQPPQPPQGDVSVGMPQIASAPSAEVSAPVTAPPVAGPTDASAPISAAELLTALAGVGGAGYLGYRAMSGNSAPQPAATPDVPPPPDPSIPSNDNAAAKPNTVANDNRVRKNANDNGPSEKAEPSVAKSIEQSVNPNTGSAVDDGISVPSKEDMGKQRVKASNANTPRGATPPPVMPPDAPLPNIANIMRQAQHNPEGVGRILEMLAKSGRLLRP